MAADAKKYQTTDDVQLFKTATAGARTLQAIAAGTAVETDGIQVTSQDEHGVFQFFKVTVGKVSGYVLSKYIEVA